ncbi:hypothetical protein SporoP33_11885 [Sporosarcina sp. P33]|nr:hypothetical protein SporoP33_11885 [Sporosarcina sp. P33]
MRGMSYNQFRKKVLCTRVRISMLEVMFEIDHEVQRQLDTRKRREIRDFILNCLKKNEPFRVKVHHTTN